MFQFIALTYNHEQYIIEHLESVKFQIESFSIKDVILTICDDGSKDQTLDLAEKWLHLNQELFQGIDVQRSEVNQGIVQNYLKAVRSIKTSNFKILAGDDIYFCNPIHTARKNIDFLVTPVIKFNSQFEFFMDLEHLRNINSMSKVRKLLKTDNPFAAPGIFMSKDLIQDEELNQHIAMFKWIEDYPTWQHLFKLQPRSMNYQVSRTPYVLYRSTVGIYGNTVNLTEKNKLFLEEEARMYAYYEVDKSAQKRMSYLNPKLYVRKLLRLSGVDKRSAQKHYVKAQQHYRLIQERAETFCADWSDVA